MTKKEANKLLKIKFPNGKIWRRNTGRFNHSNFKIAVNFEEGGKDYHYSGSFIDVLTRLEIIERDFYRVGGYKMPGEAKTAEELSDIEKKKTAINPIFCLKFNNMAIKE
jgi:hypothetical protein